MPVNPVLVPSAANDGAQPINRIEVTIVTLPDSAVLGTITADATPGSTDWDVSITGSTEATSLQVAVTVELINTSGGSPTVQFSGYVSPVSISPSGTISPIEIEMVRGPLANVFATGVSVDVAPDSVEEGEIASIAATATTSGSTGPTIFWTVLDTLILTATDSTVTGVLAGTTELIASAGRFSDTTTVVVRAPPPPTDLTISKSASVATAFEEDSVTFELVVTNPSSNELIDVPVVDTLPVGLEPAPVPADASWDPAARVLSWTVDTIAAAGADTLSFVTSVDVGTAGSDLSNTAHVGLPTGYVDPDPLNNSDVATVAIAVRSVDVRVTKTVDDPSPLPDSAVTFTVTVANDGAFEATNVQVLDVLDTLFTSPTHTPSFGTLDGDTLWTIPTLAPGASATWTTTATVAATAGGESTNNSAILVGLAQNDTTPANDTATVTMSFPVSALPEVSITAPADSAMFDPGDQVTFTGTASDLEDGDLSSSIAWTSNLDGAIGTGASASSDQLRTGVHTIVASVTDSDGGEAADSITITVALYSVPLTLNVPFSGTASLPITLSEPAPTGGVTLTVAAIDPSITAPTVSSIFIMEGAQSSNATLQGLSPGTTEVRVSNAQFGIVTSDVTVTAELDILGSAITMAPSFTESITIQFESLGVPIAAPANGLDVTLTARDPSCVSVPGTVTIAGGLINESAEVTYGGSATLTCATYVVASAPSVVPDSVLVSVVPAPTISVLSRTMGSGLQRSSSASLPLGNHGGVTVTVTSSDSNTLLVSPDANTPGTASIDVQVADGRQGVPFYVQGVEGATGTTTVTVTAPGFTDGSNTNTVVQPGIVLSGAPTNGTTTLSNNSNIYAQIGVPSGNSVSVQNIRAGGTAVTVTFTSNDVGVGTLTDGQTSGATFDRTIQPLEYRTATSIGSGGLAFDPVSAGTVTLTADATAQNILMQTNATQSAPGISVLSRTVGSGLQRSSSASLGAGNHGGVTVTVTSSDSNTLLVSPDTNTAGTASIDVQVADGSQGVPFYVQGVEGATGTATVTAPGFTDGSNTNTVVQPGIVLSGAPTNGTTTLSNNSNIYAQLGIPSGNSVNVQNIRAGGTAVTVTFTSSDVGVGTLTDGQTSGATFDRTIQPLEYRTATSIGSGGLAFDPIGTGTVTLTADATAQNILMQPNATQTATITP